MSLTPPFIAKRPSGFWPWLRFGSSRAFCESWVPHICGPIGLAMAVRAHGLPVPWTRARLVRLSVAHGVFRMEGGTIRGAFHHPLLAMARSLGLDGSVESRLGTDLVISALQADRLVLLSIDLARAGTRHRGAHLVLLYEYSSRSNSVLLHDCAKVLSPTGAAVRRDLTELSSMSNRKGLLLWRPAPLRLDPLALFPDPGREKGSHAGGEPLTPSVRLEKPANSVSFRECADGLRLDGRGGSST